MGGNIQGRGVIFLVGVMITKITPYCSGEPLQYGLFQGNLGNIPGGNINNNQQQQQQQLQNSGINSGSGSLFGGALNRQGGGLSFAIPALNLLGGNNGVNGGGNIFGVATFTRTVVSTVSTVTTASFRTCIANTAALAMTPCVAGRRRRRDVEDGADEENQVLQQIEPTPAMALIIGSTTIRDAEAVSEYLDAHKLSTQSVIYPPGMEQVASEKSKINPRLEMDEEVTTVLYSSQDTPEENFDDEEQQEEDRVVNYVSATETPGLKKDNVEVTTFAPESDDNLQENDDNLSGVSVDKARVGLGRTTTVTTVIRVTSVATSLATGMTATLTISYAGCLPPSLPISGMPCP